MSSPQPGDTLPPPWRLPEPLVLIDEPAKSAWRIWRLPVLLFLLTVVATLYSGARWGGSAFDISDLPRLLHDRPLLLAHLKLGIPFCAGLLSILVAHEFGHFFTAKAHGVDSTPPYFIPFPALVGTMGAVIRMKGRIPNRNALVDIGASGPLAGAVVAIPLLFVGLSLSPVQAIEVPHTSVPPQSLLGIGQMIAAIVHGDPQPFLGLLVEGHSLGYLLAQRLVVGSLAPGHDVMLHPLAMAAWFGLFVTALNLLPVGQLDGGHVLYAVLGRRARTVGRVVVALLVVAGVFAWMGWLLWAFLAWKVIRTSHPPVVDDTVPLTPGRRVIAWASLLLFVLTFTPVPMQQF